MSSRKWVRVHVCTLSSLETTQVRPFWYAGRFPALGGNSTLSIRKLPDRWRQCITQEEDYVAK